MKAELQNVTKCYGQTVVLENISKTLTGTTLLTGPSGRGKTTLARLLLGLEEPDGGTVKTDGRLSALFQEDRLCGQLSAVENVALVLGKRPDKAQVSRELSALGLGKEELQKPARLLSGGQKRRVSLARAMLAPADGVVLDEPFKGLDEAARKKAVLWTKQKAAGRWLLLITHDPRDLADFEGSLWQLLGKNE